MMVNEFADRTYSCGSECLCMYESDLNPSRCEISGKAVLAVYNYGEGNTGKWVGIMFAIIFGYRILGWAVLAIRK